jgi:SAM-dependent methyltransferase
MNIEADTLESNASANTECSCRICGSDSLHELATYGSLPRVTSDSKPWPAGGRLTVCTACGTIQKTADRKWLGEIEKIYGSYAIYHQSDGTEQPIFADGRPMARSVRLTEYLESKLGLPEQLNVLDFGCGTGSALRTYAARHPGWKLYGSELSTVSLPTLRKIAGFIELYTCPPEQIPERFDLITLIHALEHVLDPVGTLSALFERLTDDGHLFVQVPDCGRNPYDLVIADHLSHFTLETLGYAGHRAGCNRLALSDRVLPKELSWIGRKSDGAVGTERKPDPHDGMRKAEAHVEWLRVQAEAANRIADQSPQFGIFGTSISGTWLNSAIGGRAAFFVDEDPGRIGRRHMDMPILAPDAIPGNADVYIPLIPETAASVAARLASMGVRCHTPPAIENMNRSQEAATL